MSSSPCSVIATCTVIALCSVIVPRLCHHHPAMSVPLLCLRSPWPHIMSSMSCAVITPSSAITHVINVLRCHRSAAVAHIMSSMSCTVIALRSAMVPYYVINVLCCHCPPFCHGPILCINVLCCHHPQFSRSPILCYQCPALLSAPVQQWPHIMSSMSCAVITPSLTIASYYVTDVLCCHHSQFCHGAHILS